MPFLRDLKLEPATNGWIIKYDYLEQETNDEFSGPRFVSRPEEIFTDDDTAMNRLKELRDAKNNLDFFNTEGKRIVGEAKEAEGDEATLKIK